MVFAFVTLALGLSTPFLPASVRPFVMVVALGSGFLYVRAMNRRAREREQIEQESTATDEIVKHVEGLK